MNPFSTRRKFLGSAVVAGGVAAMSGAVSKLGVRKAEAGEAEKENYATHAKGIRILPGTWRPHYPWEHIAWVSPSWPSQDYLWLDFPEAIFTSQGLLYLSHVNPPIPTVFHDLPEVPWEETHKGIQFERTLPNGVVFGGMLTRGEESVVGMTLRLMNGTSEPLNNITLQTCVFLRAIEEFADYTRENKFVHVPKTGWISVEEARGLENGNEKYRVGWRNRGNPIADIPVMVTRSNEADRLVAMTWFEDTLSMVSNPNHPCMHADPRFKDLEPGEQQTIRGKLIFFEGPLQDFDFNRYSPS